MIPVILACRPSTFNDKNKGGYCYASASKYDNIFTHADFALALVRGGSCCGHRC